MASSLDTPHTLHIPHLATPQKKKRGRVAASCKNHSLFDYEMFESALHFCCTTTHNLSVSQSVSYSLIHSVSQSVSHAIHLHALFSLIYSSSYSFRQIDLAFGNIAARGFMECVRISYSYHMLCKYLLNKNNNSLQISPNCC